MFGEIWQGLGGHITWPAGQITWPGGHQFHPFFPLLFDTTLFLPLHHSISEDFLTWCSKAHQVRHKYLLSTFNFEE
jgi:hypothetical protein